MQKSIQEVDFYEHKVIKLFKEVEESESDSFDIFSVGEKIGLKREEIEAMYFHLSRGDMIERVRGSLVKISMYGHMIQQGQIKEGFVPS